MLDSQQNVRRSLKNHILYSIPSFSLLINGPNELYCGIPEGSSIVVVITKHKDSFLKHNLFKLSLSEVAVI